MLLWPKGRGGSRGEKRRGKKKIKRELHSEKPPDSETLQRVRPQRHPQLCGEEQRVLMCRHTILKPQCRAQTRERGEKGREAGTWPGGARRR